MEDGQEGVGVCLCARNCCNDSVQRQERLNEPSGAPVMSFMPYTLDNFSNPKALKVV